MSDRLAYRGAVDSRGSRRTRLFAFAIGLAVLLVVLAVLIAVAAPAPQTPACDQGDKCSAPPTRDPLVVQKAFTSPELGYRLEYDDRLWKIESQNDRTLQLSAAGGNLVFLITGRPGGSPRDVREAFDAQVADLRGRFLALADDTEPGSQVLGPNVGYRDAIAGTYVAAVDTPQGVQGQLRFVVQAATDGTTALVATAITSVRDANSRLGYYGAVDSILNTVKWKGQE